MSDMNMTDDGSFLDEIELLLESAVRKLLSTADFVAYHAWLREIMPHLAPTLSASLAASAEALRAFELHFARYLWCQVPDPELGFARRRLAKWERNQPCPCGSGRKYKACCALLPDVRSVFDEVSLLRYVLDDWPRKRFVELPFRRLDPEELAHVAMTWIDAGKDAAAEELLDTYFRVVEHPDARAEHALDVLFDLYLLHDRPRKRKALLERMLASPVRELRSTALHRQCAQLADLGRHDEAWRTFAAAQRHEPDHPALAQLEVTLLIGEGRQAEASTRARFWSARLARLGDENLAPLIAFLDQVSADPARAMLEMAAEGEGLKRLLTRIDALPGPEVHYRLDVDQGNAGELIPDRVMQGIANEWEATRPDLSAADAPWSDGSWIDWLQRHSPAWQSFEILDDLYDLCTLAPVPALVVEPFLLRLGERCVRLLEAVLAHNRATGCLLEWGWHGNRPALRPVALHAEALRERKPEQARDLYRWLLELNPNDNLGARMPLIHLDIATGRHDEAVELARRYPDDFAEMRYGRALAWFAIGAKGEALRALDDAQRHYPKVLKWLLAKDPRPPVTADSLGVLIGSDEEAWSYRMSHHGLWQRLGALDWARQAAPRLRRSGRA